MTFGPAAGSCSVLLSLSDLTDPALALMSHIHTFMHLHIVGQMNAHMRTHTYTHTHAPAYVNVEIC